MRVHTAGHDSPFLCTQIYRYFHRSLLTCNFVFSTSQTARDFFLSQNKGCIAGFTTKITGVKRHSRYGDVKGAARYVVVAPFYNKDILARFHSRIGNRIFLLAKVLYVDFFARGKGTMNPN